MPDRHKPLIWVGSSLKDLKRFPRSVQYDLGTGLRAAQSGSMPTASKPLKGVRGPGVLELVEDYRGDTFRAVYTVRLVGRVYVLHTFQKKSKRGIQTPKHVLDLIKLRLREAEQIHADMGEG